MLHENLIPKKYLQELQECFNNHCEWHFNQNTTYGPSESHLDEGKLGSLGFTMMFFEQERWVPSIPATLVRPLISYIHEKVEEECGEPVSLFRARADMTVYNPENHRHEVHTDFKIVEKMLNLIPVRYFKDPTLKWLDPCAGRGYFAMILYKKLFNHLKQIQNFRRLCSTN